MITISGDKELQKILKNLPLNVQKKIMRGALRDGAKLVADDARRRVPVRTGALRRAIRVQSLKRSRTRFGVEVECGKAKSKGKTFYGAFVEFGTKHISPKPFLRPAADANRRAVLEIVTRSLRTRIDGVAKEK